MTAWYNEHEPYAAAWLRNLAAAGHVASGPVDERSIEDVVATNLVGVVQAHFFAGIGGWSYALRLAGWPDDLPVWTGSCPCQPFSHAGKRLGTADARHLWPVWFRLIRECRPPVVFGEQVASAGDWYDLVRGDLEAEGYAVGMAVLGAHSVGAPHIRQRIYWVADATPGGLGGDRSAPWTLFPGHVAERCTDILGDAASLGWSRERDRPAHGIPGPGRETSFWSNPDWLPCRDGKARPVEPGTFPLAHGVPGRVGRLRAYGNAIVPQVAAQFVRAYMETGR